ncbi:response regulator [candidate division KSB1 bacterium]|nr:response regulator [candidate division KSB1 bacterium]
MEDFKGKILVVDDEFDILSLLEGLFKRKGFFVKTAENAEKALMHLKAEDYDVVIADLIMPGKNGIDLLCEIKSLYPRTGVIVLTGHGTIESAVEAIKKGAFNYIKKPINPEYLFLLTDKIIELRRLEAHNIYLQNQLRQRYSFSQIIGKSHQMNNIFQLIQDVAQTQSTVLIRGESGTGKELIANAIHFNSLRKNNKLIRVNCAVLSENLLETELFGHVRGAFTGAYRDRMGRFEMANKGTIFLDEIGDVSLNVQVKLLRVLQESEFERVGGSKTLKVDARIIAATNKNLEHAIKKGEFREDLYYRLNVIPIEVPPLRERVEDIPLLARHFAEKHNEETVKNVKGLTQDALSVLMNYDWPGNVRELENVIERAVVLTKNEYIDHSDLQPLNGLSSPDSSLNLLDHKSLPEVMNNIEKQMIINTLKQCNWNKSIASRKLGIHRTTLLSKISKYEINI